MKKKKPRLVPCGHLDAEKDEWVRYMRKIRNIYLEVWDEKIRKVYEKFGKEKT